MDKTVISPEDARTLCIWYEANRRDLPWRDTGDPYHVWVSEIMLQQTRIEAVREKYIRFISELPDIASLAACDDDRLMRLWEGLGYYSRVRNLKRCAEVLVREYNAALPEDYNTLLQLPGIGPYTAGAIAAIAFHQPAMAVDGNVLRILARLSGCRDDIRQIQTKNELTALLQDIRQFDCDPASFSQGLMELGQTVCLPGGKPHCGQCPWQYRCQAFRHDLCDEIPYRSRLKKRRITERTLLIIRDGSRFLLHRRPDSGLLAGLYEFPGYDSHLSRKEASAAVESLSLHPLRIRELPASVHVFTHLEWHMTAYEIMVEQISSLPDESYVTVTKKELAHLAVPSAFKTYIDWYSLRDQDS